MKRFLIVVMLIFAVPLLILPLVVAESHKSTVSSSITKVSILDSSDMPTIATLANDPVTPDTQPNALSGLVWWFKSDTGTQNGSVAISSAVAIDTWVNQSTNIINLTQTTGSPQPVIVLSQINGYPVIRFDGVDDRMVTTAVTESQPLTFFVVERLWAGTNAKYMWDGLSQTDSAGAWQNGTAGAINMSAGNSCCEVTQTTGTFVIETMKYNGVSSSQQMNNGTAATGDANTRSPAGLTVGAARGGIALAKVEIAEFIVYNRIVTATEEGLIETYLSHKYAITLTP